MNGKQATDPESPGQPAPGKIRFRCPGCDNPVAAPATKAGARMRCPKCKGAVTVPGAPPPAPKPKAEPVSHPGPGMLLRGDWLLFHCPGCEKWVKVRRQNFNRDIACGSCKTVFSLDLEG